MKAGVSIMLAIAVCASSSSMLVNAQKPTVGHTATLFDKAVFIQGGYGPDGVATNAAYSLLLSATGAYAGSSMLDITTLSAFSARGYHNSVDSVGGLMINCGGFGGASTASEKMSCDIFNPIKYNTTKMDMTKPNVKPRGGMAVAIGGETSVSAYFMGGSNTLDLSAPFSTDVNVLTLQSTLRWRVDTPMRVAMRYHTATWIDSVKGVVVLGGQIQGGIAVALNNAAIFSASAWTDRPIAGDIPPARFGHSAVSDDSGNIYIYGGQAAVAGAIFNDVYVLNTAAPTWAWKKINVPAAEPRAFHASVLLGDGTILHTFGQSGAAQNTAVNTFSLFNIASGAWTAAASPPTPTVALESPNKGPDTSNNPNDPNFKHTTGEDGESKGDKGGKGGVIGGAIGGIAAVGLLVAGFIFYRKRQARRHSTLGVAAGPYSKHSASASGQIGGAGRSSLHLEEGGDKSKLGRSFTIRQPAAAYVDDNSVQDLKHMRPYDDNNGYNDRSAGGYGNEPAVIEYELTDTSGHRYEPGSVAERKRYVEEQQRQLMNGFESVYPDQPLPFQHQQHRSNNSNQQEQDYYSPTLTAVSSPRGDQAKLGGRSPSQSRRKQSQDQSPSARAQQTRHDQYQDHSDQYYNNKF
ncbi:kelch domain-containing protein 3 [Linnemannia exigua]|uniref:Kelch domain-containing protein 3 n=1 Tax=Linnemannia exigua TaxID=604196 RepID=A0AAD4H1Z1_9FUNG|nr:kelch domain-containing protein 3 [Linnemannia exigua]